MNTTIHPSQWFHHTHPQEHVEHGRLWKVIHTEGFWIIVTMFLIFVGMIVMATIFGRTIPQNAPFTPLYPYP